MTSEIAVITAIFGDRDTLKDPTVITPDCRYVCFSDVPRSSRVWEVARRDARHADPRRESRQSKIRPHRFLEARHSLWIDGSFRLNTDVRGLITRHLREADIAFFRHPDRDCVFDEGELCSLVRLDEPARIDDQLVRYRRAGLPRHAGLMCGGVILRRHTPAVAEFNELWWREYESGSCRDQLSLNYALLRSRLPVASIEGDIRADAAIEFLGHRPGTTRELGGAFESPG